MARNPKCKHCKNEVNKELPFVKKSSNYYHESCYDELESIKAQKKAMKDLVPCARCGNEVNKKAKETKHKGSTKHYHVECFELLQAEEIAKSMKPCLLCEESVSPHDEGTVKNWKGYYHPQCFEKYKRQMENREKLCEYIAESYSLDYPTGFMLKQIDDFHKSRNYSYLAMLTTLKYIFEIEKIPPKDNVGIGLITFYYEKAKDYHIKLRSIGNSASNVTINNTVVKVRAVEPTRRTKAGYIDMNNI
ncbi:hypothetical protein ACIQ1D_18930 [Lysinibacillus xylanilyticus]|uniref:hypothetical protein n=1 Tax=Lysinibacillus xylanilyticus TaxID=582475 RepID=UPI00382AA0FD